MSRRLRKDSAVSRAHVEATKTSELAVWTSVEYVDGSLPQGKRPKQRPKARAGAVKGAFSTW
jgi:hypothetical protein